jgi:hypothetical protein
MLIKKKLFNLIVFLVFFCFVCLCRAGGDRTSKTKNKVAEGPISEELTDTTLETPKYDA